MRNALTLLSVLLGMASPALAQTCTGLCLQQVTCPAGQTTSISGIVYAPNGTDPLPDVLVYIPNAPVDTFQPGVQCPVVGQPPSGSPLVGTTTAVDGSFHITNVPVGANIPLVIQTGRWRRQLTIATTAACVDTAFSTRMPRNQSEGDIPKIAVATGSQDSVECVLRKVGIDDAEFTDINGTGRINLFSGSNSPGARYAQSASSETDLMGNAATLKSYDVLMLPCEGNQYAQPAAQLANVLDFANSGGRIYASHYEYVWMFQNGPFAGVVNWKVGQAQLPNGTATVDQTFYEGATLAQWLQLVGASTTVGQIPISTLRHDLNGVVAPTQSWLRLNDAGDNNPVMQFVFDTPVGATSNQCGRVLFNEYHVENPTIASRNVSFPAECPPANTALTPQEKLLEYSLFELTSDGSAATLTPSSADFGSEPLGFPTASQSFTWTNKSTFAASVTLLTATGDFNITGSNCTGVPAGNSCTINVSFNPTVLGARTGVLTVGSPGSTLTAQLTGIGTPDLTASIGPALDFGSADVGFKVTRQFVLTNVANGTVSLAAPSISGDFAVSGTCGSSLPAAASCTVNVVFAATTTGPRTGSLSLSPAGAAFSSIVIALTGNGVDFTLANNPTSGQLIAGHAITTQATATPLAGFNAGVTITCATDAPGATCNVSNNNVGLAAAQTVQITIQTVSEYQVIGYSSFGAGLWSLAGLAAAALLCFRRRTLGPALRGAIFLLLLGAVSLGATGCSGKLPAKNAVYTPAGTYTVTATATDGFLVHTATYSMKVTVN